MQPADTVAAASPQARIRNVPMPLLRAMRTVTTVSDTSVEARVAETGSIIEQHPAAAPIRITHESRVVGADAEALWLAYHANFAPLASLAILQHFYSRSEILAELANPRITKIVGWRGGEPVGLAMVTCSLEDVPQISPDFLRASYPEHAARNAIYFGILMMVSPEVRGRTLFSRLYTEMWQVPARAGGVLVFDICEFNRLAFDTDALTQRIADNFPHSSVKVLDRQTWYVADLPHPIGDHPTMSTD
jgi:hypothetical protein